MPESKYLTALPYGSEPTWLNKDDAARLNSYAVYDAMFKVLPESFSVTLRGTDEPILIPTAKGIINTLSRFVGRGFDVSMDPTIGTPEQQAEAKAHMDSFIRRERLKSKFKTAVREHMQYGDAFWYIRADSNKPEGQRISLTTLDPNTVFWLPDPDDNTKNAGVAIIEQTTKDDTVLVKRQRWIKGTHPDHPNYNEETPNYEALVYHDVMTFELDGWEEPDASPVETLVSDVFLPVTTLPIYGWKNSASSDDRYGTSELQGLERVFAGINQAISDEDVSLAMAGLGMYKSSSGGPVDADGNEVDWVIGPGRVIEDGTFDRVAGVTSVAPALEHIAYLEAKADAISGVTDVARGGVTADVAESGVALAIKMAPTIDAAEEKDQEIREVFDNLLHDLKAWFAAVEGWKTEEVQFNTYFSSKMPSNRESEIKEIMALVDAKILSVQFAQELLKSKYGYDIPADMMKQIAEESAALAVAADPYGGRMAEESAPPVEEEPVS